MKSKLITKLALAAAIACAAVGARAGSITFKLQNIYPTVDKGTLSAYFFVSSPDTSSLYKGATMDKVLSVLGGKDTTSKIDDLYLHYWWATGFKSKDTEVSQTTNVSGTPGDFSVFAVLFDAQTYTDANNYMIATATVDGKSTPYLTGSLPKTNSSTTLNWGSQTSNSWISIASIPEPTSGVLLLVGLSALALRRKRVA